jgi:hypothetical protein
MTVPRSRVKIIVRVELVTDWGDASTVEVGQIERPSQSLEPETVGLSLEDGKRLLHSLQQAVIPAQTEEICALRRVCQGCHRWTEVKDYRKRKVDTVFGTVTFRSPRIISCHCEPPFFLATPLCPLLPIIPERATPELLTLQAKLSAQMPYRQVVGTMREFLPVSDKFNHVTIRNRALRVGARIDKVGQSATAMPLAGECTIAIDGGFVRGTGKANTRNFEVLTGRLAAPGVKPYVFAWVRSEVPSTTDRVAALARAQTGEVRPQLSLITDGANGIQRIHRQLPFPAKPILDWFHISMRVRYLEQIIGGLWPRSETERCAKKLLAEYVGKLRWCFWHANVQKAQERMRQILMVCRIVVCETPKFKQSLEQLDYRLREFFAYLESNKGATIDYGTRYRAGKPISTAMAESAVNQVLNARMCKRQQMRWTPRGAHLLAQVRCAVINGDLTAKLRAYKAEQTEAEEIPGEVTRFLDLLQRAAA